MPDTKISALAAGTALAAGDLFVAVDVSDTSMAATGTDKKWTVTTITADPLFVFKPGGVVLTDAAQTFTSGAPADITWGTEVSDPDNWTAGGIATLTVPASKGGRYAVSYTGLWSATSLGVNDGVIALINGVGIGGGRADNAFGGVAVGFIRTFVAGDTLKFQAFQNVGANRDLVSRLEIAPV